MEDKIPSKTQTEVDKLFKTYILKLSHFSFKMRKYKAVFKIQLIITLLVSKIAIYDYTISEHTFPV